MSQSDPYEVFEGTASPIFRLEAERVAGSYCNNVNILNSQWDFMFDFGQLVPVASDGEGNMQVELRHIERILMSPAHAKAFLRVLETNVSGWEERFGEIDLTRVQINEG